MKRIRIYRNPHCARCARFAKAHRLLDWLGHVDVSTEDPATGPLRMGEVVVEDLSTHKLFRGAEGIELIWHHIPVYALFLPLMKLPAFRRYVDKEVRGCDGESCAV